MDLILCPPDLYYAYGSTRCRKGKEQLWLGSYAVYAYNGAQKERVHCIGALNEVWQ